MTFSIIALPIPRKRNAEWTLIPIVPTWRTFRLGPGQTLEMPIMAPLAEFAGSSRHLIVTAYQSANGLVNLVNPTFAVVMGGLAIGRVGYDRWLKFVAPLLLLLVIIISAVLSIGAI